MVSSEYVIQKYCNTADKYTELLCGICEERSRGIVNDEQDLKIAKMFEKMDGHFELFLDDKRFKNLLGSRDKESYEYMLELMDLDRRTFHQLRKSWEDIKEKKETWKVKKLIKLATKTGSFINGIVNEELQKDHKEAYMRAVFLSNVILSIVGLLFIMNHLGENSIILHNVILYVFSPIAAGLKALTFATGPESWSTPFRGKLYQRAFNNVRVILNKPDHPYAT
ncbi:MAG TPA: hypothetical protein VJB12_00210 [Candidatus Nanoarchaeia archaeon]|nr:hypothetical protein [Candidatus Nanoarchaeia archaeon]